MTDYQFVQERALLQQENEQIKAKYKKSLQELMHILKVNKSLKEFLDQNTKHSEDSIKEKINDLKNNHQQELQAYIKELSNYKQLFNEQTIKISHLERKNQDLYKELTQNRQQCHLFQQRVKQFDSTRHNQKKDETLTNQQLKKKVMNYLELVRQKDQLQEQNEQLKQNINKLSMELVQQKQKYRNDIFKQERELLRCKESQYLKFITIESKYQLLESELNNYKQAERQLDQQSNVLDQDSVYNSIREQITKINQDFNKYQVESSYLLQKKRQEDAERERKLLELSKEVARLRDYEESSIARQKENSSLKTQVSILKQRINLLTSQQQQYVQKIHVLQALTTTDKHRAHSPISDRIQEFENRIKLLLQDNCKHSTIPSINSSAQQIIMLKGYILELSGLIKEARRKEQHLLKKNHQYKQKVTKAEVLYREKINQYKIKINNYDVLINKLYSTLEQKMKERVPEEIEREFNTAITSYEEKMMQMSEEIIRLRAKTTQLENNKEQKLNSQIQSLQIENQTYKQIISQLSIRLNEVEMQRGKKKYGQEELNQIEEKDKIIDELAMEVNSLNIVVNDFREKESNMKDIIQSYEQEVVKYKQQLEQKQKISNNLSRNSIDAASLIQKINYLQYELNKYKTRAQPTPKPDDFIKGLENKLNAQNQQLTQYKQEIDKLYHQLKTEKNEKTTNTVDQYSLISSLQKQITDGEIKVLSLENQLRNKQASYKDQIETLKYQNKALIQQLNSKHSEMMIYYEQLNNKIQNQRDMSRIPQMERYIADLQQKNHQIFSRFTQEAKQLNSNILALRTNNLTLRNQLQNKEDAINDLKHQLFNAELRTQKERSISGSMIKSISNSNVRDTFKDDNEEKLLALIVLLNTQVQSLRQRNDQIGPMQNEIDSLRLKNQRLEAMYHEDLDKYREALKLLETKQMELCNSLHLSSNEVHESKESKASNVLQFSAEQISHLQQTSRTLIVENSGETAIRSYEAHNSVVQKNTPSSLIIHSNVSIEQSPHRAKKINIKKIV